MAIQLVAAVVLACLALPTFAFHDPHCDGNRHTIVHLFEWRWKDIASECESFLGPNGYCAVQISPPSENRVVNNPNRPWWERYQPISYKLVTRSGNEADFKDMVNRCAKSGVRIYVDAVINHMAGVGGSGQGTGGTNWNSQSLDFPGVPYSKNDFNDGNMCHSHDGGIHDYGNPEEVRNCKLEGLTDLKLGSDYVRNKIAGYMNHLTDLGVAGFRVDAAKHMWPGDLVGLFGKLKNAQMGGQPFVYQEVIDRGGEPIKGEEYLKTGRITNFKFGRELAAVFRRQNPMKYLKNFGEGWGMWNGLDVVNFIDNHDNQRDDGAVLTYKNSRPYKLATAFMLAHPYGMPRVMSSFKFNSRDQGPPQDGNHNLLPVTHNGDLCGNGWVCEHRWRQIYNMVAFRNIAAGTGVNNWWSGADYQIAFSRGNKAFIALNLENFYIDTYLQTGLPGGTYCDIISGNLENGKCTGKSVTVAGDGKAKINVCNDCADPMIAIHIGAKVGSPARRM